MKSPACSVRQPADPEKLSALATYPELLAELLLARGIEDVEAADAFLNPSYDEHLHDPFLLPDMEKAVTRIHEAMEKKERIVVYSDYDCDGIPGGALLHDFFTRAGYENFENYIPHRHKEGYGLNTTALDELAARGANLVITVDSGIVDFDQVDHANSLGLDVIVTDHHLPGETLPAALAVINPKRADSTYPYDGLCGAGVAFKLASALATRGRESGLFEIKEGHEKWWLDLAGIATVADMVPLTGENRVLARYGLLVLRKSPRAGIRMLCKKMKLDQRTLTEDDIGFMIAPRINAASRMDRPEDAFKLLTAGDDDEAGLYAEHLNKINDERKGMVASMVREIKRRLSLLDDIRDVIVMGNPQWRPALLGLAANSLVEEHGKPVFLWGREGGATIKGSCRSDGSVDLVELMRATEDVFAEFGGHKFSGGFSLVGDKIHSLEEKLIAAYHEVKNGGGGIEPVVVDRALRLDDVSWNTFRQIDMLAPFGDGNPKPVFLLENVTISSIDHFGRDKNHLKLTFLKSDAAPVEAISFFKTSNDFSAVLEEGAAITLVATMEKSNFRGRPELRLRIVDISV